MVTNFLKTKLESSAIAIACCSAILAVQAPASAFSITGTSNHNDLLSALLGDTTGLSNFEIETEILSGGTIVSDPGAFGLFSDDPFGLGSGIVLSTGSAEDAVGQNTSSDSGSDYSVDLGWDGSPDSVSLKLTFDADETAQKLFFTYVFASEEFLEYGGSMFNDSFSLLLNGVNLAKLSTGEAVTINNLVPNPDGPYHPDYVDNAVDSGSVSNVFKLDGYTTPLTFEGLLNSGGSNELVLNIQDIGDGIYDSALFVKGNVGVVDPGKDVPEPSALVGLLVLGTTGVLRNRISK